MGSPLNVGSVSSVIPCFWGLLQSLTEALYTCEEVDKDADAGNGFAVVSVWIRLTLDCAVRTRWLANYKVKHP